MSKSGLTKCFGSNSDGQITVPSGFTNGSASQIAAGRIHTCMLKNDAFKCFGNNDFNQIDIPTEFSAGVD